MTAQFGDVGNAVLAARCRPPRPPRRRGVARVDRGGARRAAQRGRLHRRRHRGRQPRRQGPVLGAAATDPSPPPARHLAIEHHAAARPGAAGSPSTRAPGRRVPPSTASAGSTSTRCAPRSTRDPSRSPLVGGDVGQQRGRHRAADRRARRDRARARHPVAHRRGAGRRPARRSTSPPPASTR